LTVADEVYGALKKITVK